MAAAARKATPAKVEDKVGDSSEASTSEDAPAPVRSVLKVSAPLVQVQIGKQVLHLFSGDVVPDGVSVEQIKHLSDLGYVSDES